MANKKLASCSGTRPMTQGEIIAAIRESYAGATSISIHVNAENANVDVNYGPRVTNKTGLAEPISK